MPSFLSEYHPQSIKQQKTLHFCCWDFWIANKVFDWLSEAREREIHRSLDTVCFLYWFGLLHCLLMLCYHWVILKGRPCLETAGEMPRYLGTSVYCLTGSFLWCSFTPLTVIKSVIDAPKNEECCITWMFALVHQLNWLDMYTMLKVQISSICIKPGFLLHYVCMLRA